LVVGNSLSARCSSFRITTFREADTAAAIPDCIAKKFVSSMRPSKSWSQTSRLWFRSSSSAMMRSELSAATLTTPSRTYCTSGSWRRMCSVDLLSLKVKAEGVGTTLRPDIFLRLRITSRVTWSAKGCHTSGASPDTSKGTTTT
jgi:hypothetical protein